MNKLISKKTPIRFCLHLALLGLLSLAVLPVWCDDFPGKGNRVAWSSALPYYNLANKYLEHGHYQEAKNNFEEAIYRYEFDPDFYVNYGVALRKLESYSAAEEAFKKAIELRESDWQSWSNLANAYLKQNKLKETIATFQKAMKVQPPPPPEERAAMLKDIADINKILSMQAPPPAGDSKKTQANSAQGTATKQRKTAGAASKGTISSRNNSKSVALKRPSAEAKLTLSQKPVEDENAGAAVSQPAVSSAAEKQALKKSGWDWVQ